MTPNQQYETYIAAADRWDKQAFDSHLIGWLLSAVTEEERTAALDAAAAHVNRGAA